MCHGKQFYIQDLGETTMKLDINKYYALYTTSNHIENRLVKILGYIGYDRASEYRSMVENVAINEKFISTSGDTIAYLKNQTYYDCAVVENSNGQYVMTGERIIVWDDIIDLERTQKLNDSFVYKLEFNFKNLAPSDSFTKDDIIETIKNAITTKYNSATSEKVFVELTEVLDNSLNSDASKIQQMEEIIDKSHDSLNALVSLQDSAYALAASFMDNNINGRVTDLSNRLQSVENSINTILSSLK